MFHYIISKIKIKCKTYIFDWIEYRGNLCGGVANLLDRWEPAFPISEVERKIVDRELKLKLH